MTAEARAKWWGDRNKLWTFIVLLLLSVVLGALYSSNYTRSRLKKAFIHASRNSLLRTLYTEALLKERLTFSTSFHCAIRDTIRERGEIRRNGCEERRLNRWWRSFGESGRWPNRVGRRRLAAASTPSPPKAIAPTPTATASPSALSGSARGTINKRDRIAPQLSLYRSRNDALRQ